MLFKLRRTSLIMIIHFYSLPATEGENAVDRVYFPDLCVFDLVKGQLRNYSNDPETMAVAAQICRFRAPDEYVCEFEVDDSLVFKIASAAIGVQEANQHLQGLAKPLVDLLPKG